MQETKKAFRQLQKKNDLQIAANALCNLKGVGPGLASGEPKLRFHWAHQNQSSIEFFGPIYDMHKITIFSFLIAINPTNNEPP